MTVMRIFPRPSNAAGLAIILVLLATSAVTIFEFEKERSRLEEALQLTAAAMSDTVDHELLRVKNFTQALAEASNLQIEGGDLSAARTMALNALAAGDIADHIAFTDASGQQLFNTLIPWGQKLPITKNLDRIRQVLATGAPSVSDMIVGTVSGNHEITVDAPVTRDGRVTSVLSSVIRSDHLAGVLPRKNLPAGWEATIFDRRGTVVARTHDPERFVGQKVSERLQAQLAKESFAVFENIDLNDVTIIAAFNRSDSSGFGVVLGVPKTLLWRQAAGSLVAPVVFIIIAMTSLLASWHLSVTLKQRHENERRFRLLFEKAAVPLGLVSPDGRILTRNQSFEKVFGYTLVDLPSIEDWWRLAYPDPDYRAKVILQWSAAVARATATGEEIEAREYRVCCKDGSFRDVLISAIVLPEGLISTFVDITELRRTEQALSAALAEQEQARLAALNQMKVAVAVAAALQESEERLSFALSATQEAVWDFDAVTEKVTHNGRWNEVLGITDGFLEHSAEIFFERIHPEDREGMRAAIDSTRRGDDEYHAEYRLRRSDGSYCWVADHGRVVARDTEGQPLRIVGAAADITQRRRDEDRIRKLSLAVEQSPESIIITNLDGEIEYVNAAFISCTGYGSAEVIGRNPRILHSGKTPQQNYADLWDALTRGQSWKGELHNRRKDGSEYVDFANISPIRQADGRITHYVAVQEDITEKKRLALELDQYRNHLEELVELRTQELSDAKAAAERANAAKSVFLANMSHEIRTPLNAVLGFAQVGIRDSDERKSQDHFAHILDSGQGLLQVINDILDTSKLEAGRLGLEQIPMEPGEVIDNSLRLVTLLALAKGLTLTVAEAPDLPAACLGDPGRLRQVLANLLTNAVKFTPAGGSVMLAAAREQDHLTFTVSDTGIGIAADAVERLFRPFEQADATTTRRFGGTGLGLSISRQLVELMGGTISVNSVPGQGCSFQLRLPLSGAVPAAAVDELMVIAVSLPDQEAEILANGFAHCLAIADLDHLPDYSSLGSTPEPTLVVVDGSVLETSTAKVKAALECGVNLAAVLNPDHPPLTARWANDLVMVERPLRCRHLRRAWSAAPPAPRAAPLLERLAGLVVLAAEDNAVNRLVLEDMLRGEGAEVILCEDGEQALERVRRSGGREIDVLLTDIQMPGMDGYALARAVAEQAPDLPIIGLTAHAMAEDRESCLAAGMVEHISKPVELDRLVAVIRHRARPRVRPMVITAAAPTARDSDRPAPPSPAAIGGDDLERLRRGLAGIDDIDLTSNSSFFAKPARYIGYLVKYAEKHGDSMVRLRKGLAAGDRDLVRQVAHSLRGASGQIGVIGIHALASDLEEAIADHADDETILIRTAEIEKRLAVVCQAINKLGEQGGTDV